MDDLRLVHRLEALEDVLEHGAREDRVEPLRGFGDIGAKLLARERRDDEEGQPVGRRPRVEDPDHVLVVDPLGEVDLALEAAALGLGRGALEHDLDRDVASYAPAFWPRKTAPMPPAPRSSTIV